MLRNVDVHGHAGAHRDVSVLVGLPLVLQAQQVRLERRAQLEQLVLQAPLELLQPPVLQVLLVRRALLEQPVQLKVQQQQLM
jgi:hypothetical protein